MDVAGRTVLLIDDGLATGASMRVAVEALRRMGPARIVVGVPVGAPDTCAALAAVADQAVCAIMPERFQAVGEFYGDFGQIDDAEVSALLAGPEPSISSMPILLSVDGVELAGELDIPDAARGVVMMVHGGGSSRKNPHTRVVAARLAQQGLATLFYDLLTEAEEAAELTSAHLRFDIPFLAERLVHAFDWLIDDPRTRGLPIGILGASTGAAAALVAAVRRRALTAAVVSRSGRPDLAGDALGRVVAPTLLIVGERDVPVVELNRQALAALGSEKELAVVPGATHLFEEPGALDEVARLSCRWFLRHFGAWAEHAPP
jgi:putative phosphoribosyl transferase